MRCCDCNEAEGTMPVGERAVCDPCNDERIRRWRRMHAQSFTPDPGSLLAPGGGMRSVVWEWRRAGLLA